MSYFVQDGSFTPEQVEFILQLPALSAPPGVKPNFDHPNGVRELGYALVIVSSILAAISMAVRLHWRFMITRKFAIQDVLFIAALVRAPGTLYAKVNKS